MYHRQWYWLADLCEEHGIEFVLGHALYMRVTQPFASFRVSGGAFETTRVEPVRRADGYVVYKISGANDYRLRPVVVDLSSHVGDDIFIRLVDNDKGASTAAYIRENPFAHINFDDFRFYAERPSLPDEIIPSEIETLPG